MRDTNQVLGLIFVALGAAVLSVSPHGGAYDQLLEMQARMVGLEHAMRDDRISLVTNYAGVIRAAGVFVLVLGLGLLVVPWINALIYRRPTAVQVID